MEDVKKELPKFVRMLNADGSLSTTFRLGGQQTYWRDGGLWGVDAKWVGDELFSVNPYDKDGVR